MIDFDQFYQLLLKFTQEGLLPAFLIGVGAGVGLLAASSRFLGGRVGLTKELREQIAGLKTREAKLVEANEGFAEQLKSTASVRALLNDKVNAQHGQLEHMSRTQEQLSGACERLKTENAGLSEKIKIERKGRRDSEKIAKALTAQLDDIMKSDGKIWLQPVKGTVPEFLPLASRRTPIIAVANLKGGVGKTTITANLGAIMAIEGLRVLMIDLDHQGSLTNLCLDDDEAVEVHRAKRYVDSVFSDPGDLSGLNSIVHKLGVEVGSGRIHLAPTQDPFSELETQIMTRWNAGLADRDARYLLRSVLHCHELRDHYDVVLIDCPPRLTTGSINALAASDYVLVPVLLQETSTDAVPRTLSWIQRFRDQANPDLGLLGIVGNRAYPRNKLVDREQILWNALNDVAPGMWNGPVRLFNEIIRDHLTINGRFAALDEKHQPRYRSLLNLIRREIPHAGLNASAVHHITYPAAGSVGA